jgi:hypothetical protein
MITARNIQRIINLDFNSYLLLPQYSHSFLKNEKHGFNQFKTTTTKMQLGSLVDAIRTSGPVDMRHPLYPIAKVIAAHLKAELGWALDKLQKQVSYTGVMRYDAGKAIFELPVKGRPDFELPGELIVDLKVTGESKHKVDGMIKFMGYPNQQFGYAKLGGVKTALLLIYTTKTNEILPLKRITIGETNSFWEEKILKFGKAV